MKPMTRIEQALATAIASGESPDCPPKLAGAIRHAVFPGGARIRPQLCLAVAQACGDDDPGLSEAAASVRLSLGFSSTDADVDRALEVIPAAVARLRAATVPA